MQTTEADRYLRLLRADGERLAAVAAGALDSDVPPCPGWTVRDVVVHTGQVYLDKVAQMRTGQRTEWPPGPAPEGDPLPWFHDALGTLTGELVARGPDAASYTWWPADQTVGFWFRRMAQETAVHRVDAESATGAMTAVDTWLAVDGIDEVLQMFLPGDWSEEPQDAATGRSVTVRTADSLWRLALGRESVECALDAGPADATVTGEPSELLLWLWGRRPDSAVRFEGDHSAARELRERLVLATQ